MITTEFLLVWDIYYNHWGKEAQVANKRQHATKLLFDVLRSSDWVQHICFLSRYLGTEYNCEELITLFKEFSEICFRDTFISSYPQNVSERLKKNLHNKIKDECQPPTRYQWNSMHSPSLAHVGGNIYDPCISRVYAIVSFF